jgi:hypothetical protein
MTSVHAFTDFKYHGWTVEKAVVGLARGGSCTSIYASTEVGRLISYPSFQRVDLNLKIPQALIMEFERLESVHKKLADWKDGPMPKFDIFQNFCNSGKSFV